MKFNFNPLTAQFELQSNDCGGGGGGEVTYPSSPTIQNVEIALADTETPIVFPVGTRKIFLKVRDYTATLKLSYESGESGTNYISITRGNSYTEDNIITVTGNTTIYIQSTKPNVVIECLTWA